MALVIGGLIAASFTASEVEAFREASTPDLEPVAAVTGPAKGCDRFLALLHGMIRDKTDDAEGDRRFAQLRDAARQSDVLLASDLQDMINADSAADVSAAGQIIMRRCVAAGHTSQAEVQGLASAGLNTFAAPVTPAAPSRRAAPPPAPPQADVAGGVAAAREACELFKHMFSTDVPIEDSGQVFREAADASQRAALADVASWRALRDAMHTGVSLYTTAGSDGDAVIASFEEIGRLCGKFIVPPS